MSMSVRRCHLVVVAAAVALATTACTASGSNSSNDASSNKPVTITFWHGWSQPSEVNAIKANIAGFEKKHPNIHVKMVGNVTDDTINQALRAGGSKAPDVVSSFTTDNVGQYCSSGMWVNLDPFLKKSGIDKAKTFTKATLQYTQYKGDQCALPLLSDAFGLYYNLDMFKAAGIARPPHTMSEFTADAVKLTKYQGGSYKQLGFMPDYHSYESTAVHMMAQWSPKYLTADGKSNLASDPHVEQFLTWQLGMVNALGGYQKLDRFRTTFGQEFSANNAFEVGKVAMQIDGEWRVASIKNDKSKVHYATAPMPVPDDQAASYGKGYITGTIIGIAHSSRHQQAAWQLVKYLTTNTHALDSFANAIDNVPTTYAALKSPELTDDKNFRTFVKIEQDPQSTTTPPSVNGGKYQQTFQNFAFDVQAGKVKDIHAGLQGVDKQIDTDNQQAQG